MSRAVEKQVDPGDFSCTSYLNDEPSNDIDRWIHIVDCS
jgi:hypothetical protein